ncbi:hypothetical protein F5Y09DRAFT_334522 [Xylaria sp. FL1042]|nr:hypothetical protein F5Y09DRAFT_334522 [Xylaria sp. FL1042]
MASGEAIFDVKATAPVNNTNLIYRHVTPTSPPRLSPLEGFMPRAYVRQIFCFLTTNPQAVGTLSRGLFGLARDVPYVLSRVISDKSRTTGSGVAISTPCQSPEDIFSWHDLSQSIDYATLKAGHFAPGAFLAPGVIPPDTLPPYPASPAVFLARASLVHGGLILCVAVHHVVTDITGFDALLKIWAAYCRGGSSRDVGFDVSWMDRSPLFSVTESSSSGAPMPELLHIKTPEETIRGTRPGTGTEKKNYQTGIFYFPRRHLRALKEAVNLHVAEQEAGSWVSTSDILSSLLWNTVIGAQEHTDSEEAVTHKDTRVSTLSFPVQFRAALRPELPRNFLGAAFLMTSARVPHEDVRLISSRFGNNSVASTALEQGVTPQSQADVDVEGLARSVVDISALAKAALAIRRSVQGIDDAAVREVLAYLEAHPGIANPKAPLVLGPPRCEAGGSATSVVSWADQCVYKLDWGDAVGPCDTVRLAKMAYKRDPIVLPHIPSCDGDGGGVEVIMSYEADLMQRVMEWPVMKQFATLLCLS